MQYTVSLLVERMQVDHNKSSARDLFLQYLEETWERIRNLPWSWNWRNEFQVTYSPITLLETYTATRGSTILHSGVATTAIVSHVGREIILDEEVYVVMAVGFPTANDITLNRVYTGPTTADLAVILYRRDIAVKSSMIKCVRLDGVDLYRISDEQEYRNYRGYTYSYPESTEPSIYFLDRTDTRIPAPRYPPFLVTTGAGVGLDAGEHTFFFVYEDVETGLQGPPGPVLTLTMSGFIYTAYYRSVATNVGENGYRLVLYANTIPSNPEHVRRPYFRVGQKTSLLVASTISVAIADSTLIYQDRHYNGRWLRVAFLDYPDDVYTVELRVVNNWGVRLQLTDTLQIGDDTDLIRLFNAHMISFNNKEPDKALLMMESFERHLKHLLSKEINEDADPEIGGLIHQTPYVGENTNILDFDPTMLRLPSGY